MSYRRRGFGFLALFALGGCSSLQPVRGPAPEPGARLAFDINDAGRVALGETMGAEIAQVEGHLLDQEDSAYVLAVTGISFLRGGFQAWSRETVRLRPEYVGNTYERRFSATRSLVLAAVSVGGIAAIVAGRSLISLGPDDDDDEKDPPPGDERRVRP